MTNAVSATAQSHFEDLKCSGTSVAIVREVVVIVTTNDEVEVPLTVNVPGATEQAAPLGAPVQVSAACPFHPAPPIERLYVAGEPAGTVALFELAVRPKLLALPDRATVCGLPVALSVTVRPAVAFPPAVGLNVTLMTQLPPG
jgi:hypothetical protein